MLEILQGAEPGVDLLVAALGGADRPGASRVARRRFGAVVLSLAVGQADRVNRGEVDDVETHAGNLRQQLFALAEGAVAVPFRAAGAGEKFVPGAEQGFLPVDRDRQLFPVMGHHGRIVVDGHQFRQLLLAGDRQGGGIVRRPAQAPGIILQTRPVVMAGAAGGCLDEFDTDQAVDGEKAAGLEFFLQVGAPGGEMIDPAGQGEEVGAELVDAESGFPAVIDHQAHRRLVPLLFALVAVKEDGCQFVVAVGEDVGLHHHRFAEHPLAGITAAVDLRRHPLDHHPPPAILGDFGGWGGRGLRSIGHRISSFSLIFPFYCLGKL